MVSKPRTVWFVLALAMSLALPAELSAAPGPEARDNAVKVKRQKSRVPKGYGFLPGYEHPLPAGGPRGRASWQSSWGERRYWYWGQWRYGYGPPGFYRGRWNGGSIGPCYTQTPIGPIWNCGR